jgi:hypothetical protein
MALRFRDRYYRLDRVDPPAAAGGRWTYRFAFWPSEIVFRRLVDYEQDSAERRAQRSSTLGAKLSSWISGKRE